MTKYVVMWEEEAIVVCKTRADAEEYIFSEVEEMAYEEFLEDAGNWEPNSYFKSMQYDLKNENIWRMTYNRPIENLYAYILNCNVHGWYIQEVKELD